MKEPGDKKAESANLRQPLLQVKKNKLRLDTSEDDRFYKKQRMKRTQTLHIERDSRLSVNGYCLAEEINLQVRYTLFESTYSFKSEDECHIYYDPKISKYLFIFDFGVIVFWNFLENEEKLIIKKIERLFVDKLPIEEMEKDYMLFREAIVENPRLDDNTIYLTTEEIYEKFAHSYAFAQSLKLDLFENKVDKTFKETELIPKNLASQGSVKLGQNKIYQMIGNIFMLRSSVNLMSGMLDCPDCFWNEATWEDIYNKARDYYDLEERIEVINNRLDLIKELYDMLNDDLHNKHTANLEWIVIWLIFAEIIIEIVWNILIKDIFKLI